MKTQTLTEMYDAGADDQEAANAFKLFNLLKPGLKVKRNGRVDTSGGDKTILGLYRMIGGQVFS